MEKITKPDEQWRKQLTAEHEVARRKGTEPPFTRNYHDCHDDGSYRSVCCGATLFDSSSKFELGTGWHSFLQPVAHASGLTVFAEELYLSANHVTVIGALRSVVPLC